MNRHGFPFRCMLFVISLGKNREIISNSHKKSIPDNGLNVFNQLSGMHFVPRTRLELAQPYGH